MKVGVLANSSLALPSIGRLAKQGLLAAALIPVGANELAKSIRCIIEAAGTSLRLRSIAAADNIPWPAVRRMIVKRQLVKWLHAVQPDVVFVLTFPHRIPRSILDTPRHGFYNFHPGLLPTYRGPDPAFWQIRNCEPYGGITVHRMDAGWDTGPIAILERIAIHPDDTYGLHQGRLASTAANLSDRLVASLRSDRIQLYTQDGASARYYSRPSMADVVMDWSQPATAVKALVKACNPWSRGAATSVGGTGLRIVEVSEVTIADGLHEIAPGTIVRANPRQGICVVCGDGKTLRIDIAYTEDGFVSGNRLAEVGLRGRGSLLHPPSRFDSGGSPETVGPKNER